MASDGQRTLVVGKTGSGKSVFTQRVIYDEPRLVIFDPKGTYRRDAKRLGLHPCSELSELVEAYQDCSDGNFRLTYTPAPYSGERELSDFCHMVEVLQLSYLNGTGGAPVMLVVEEAHQLNPNPPSQEHQGFARIVQMGREMGVSVLAVTQRPQSISKWFRENVDCMVAFEVMGADAASAAARCADDDPELIRAIQGLSNYRYVVWRSGKWAVKEPICL